MSSAPPDPLPPDENAGPTLLTVVTVLTALVIITCSLRIYVRASLKILGWDDYTIIAATLLAVARMGIQVAEVVMYQDGRHRWYVSQSDYDNNNMLGWYTQVFLFANTCLLKFSICLLILRIKDTPKLRFFLYVVMAGLFITNFGCIVILLAECRPISVYWTGAGGTCWDTRVRIYSIYATIAYSILTDFICSFLPLVVVWKVRMSLKKKMSVWALMSLGLVATGFAIARAASLGLATNDLSWTYCFAAIWSDLELYLGIIATNLALSPSIYNFIRHGQDSRQGWSQSSKSKFSSRSGYINESALRGDKFEPPEIMVGAGSRPGSKSRCEDSGNIYKKTEFIVLEEQGKDEATRPHDIV